MKLSENFTLEELTYSVTAEANNIINKPCEPVIDNLRELCLNVLQPLRTVINCPIIVTSGFRCAELNKKIGGRPNSQHLTGHAVDFIVTQKPLKEVFNYIKNNLPYDQLLFEYNKTDKWIHVSYRADGRNRKHCIDNYKVL